MQAAHRRLRLGVTRSEFCGVLHASEWHSAAAHSGFVGEFMVILGAVQYNFWIAMVAGTTLVLGAAYSLWMYKRVIFGDVANQQVAALVDVNTREFAILAMLAAAVLWMGLYPKPVTDLMDASVTQLLRHVAESKLPLDAPIGAVR